MRLALLILCLFSPVHAHAGPLLIVAAIVSAVTAVSIAVIATVAIAVGTVIYGKAQAKKAERQARDAINAALRDRMVNRIATEAPHRHIYGRAKVGSSIVAMFTTGDKDQYRHMVCVHANHECDAIETVYVNNVAVTSLDADGDATVGRYSPNSNSGVEEEARIGPTFTLTYTPKVGTVHVYKGSGASIEPVTITGTSGSNITVAYTGPVTVVYDRSTGRKFSEIFIAAVAPEKTPLVRIRTHRGGPSDPVDAYLNSILPGKWPATAVLRGMCYSVITLNLNHPEFQGGPVPIHALIRGKKLYDPRTGTTAWSANPALAIRDYLTGPLCVVPASDLPAAEFIAAANVCDEVIAGEPRYTLNGDVMSDQAQADVLEKMAQSMAGGIVSTTWEIFAGKYIAPVMALDQSDIVGSIQVTPGPSDSVIYNGVKGQYVSSETKYVLTDFKPYQNAAYRAYDARDLYTNIDFPFSDSLQRVTNLARIFTEDMRNGFTITAEFSLKAWPLKVGQRVTFTSAYLGQSAKVYRITDKSFSPSSAVQLTLKEDAASIWDFADSVSVDSTPNTDLPDPFEIDPLVSIALSAGEATLLRQADGTTVPRLLVSWPLAPTVTVQDTGQIEIEWRAVGSGVWSKTSVPGDVTEAYLSPITPGWAYVVRACCANPSIGTKSNWTSAQYQVKVFNAYPSVYKWSDSIPSAPSAAASYTWGTSAYGSAPSGWSLTLPAKPTTGPDVTLYAATVTVSDVSNTGSTSFQWATANVSTLSHAAVAGLAAAAAAQETANDAAAQAALAITKYDNIALDSVLDRSEKAEVVLDWTAISDENGGIIAQATALGVSFSVYSAAVTGLSSYLSGMSPAWYDTTQDTIIVRTTFISMWASYYSAKSALLGAIASKAAAAPLATIGGRNLQPDGGFERGTHPCTEKSGAVGTVSTFNYVGVYAGSRALFFETASGDAYLYIGGGKTPVVAGRSYMLSFLYKTSTSASITGSSTFIRYNTGVNVAMPLPILHTGSNSWTVCEMAWTCPSGVTDIEFRFGIGSSGYAWMGVDCIQVEEGNKRTQWSPAPEDYLADIAVAQAAADAAAIQADAAITKYDSIAADSILDRGEKPQVVLDWAVISGEYAGLVAKAGDLSVSSTTYTSAKNALNTYLTGLSPTWSDTSQDSAVVRATFNTKWTDYYNAKAALEAAIYAKTATLAAWSGVTGPNKPDDNATAGAPTGTDVAGVPAATVASGATAGAAAQAALNNPPVLSGLYDVSFNGASNNVYVNYVTFTASTTGGSGTPTYNWVLSTYFGTMELTASTGATVTVRGKANNLYCIGVATCTVTSGNGMTDTMSCEISVGHGSGVAP